MKKLRFVLCLLLAFSGSFARAQLGTFTTLTTTWNGLTRTYSVYVPPVLQPNPPLVLALHGAAVTTQSDPPLTACTQGMGWDAIADANGFLLVCPIATYIPGTPSGRFLWESYGTDTYFPTAPDDSGFLRSLILMMQQPVASGGYVVDSTRTFIMGFSSGAMMAHRACILNADVVAACAMASGPVWVGSPAPTIPNPSQAVSIIELHGDADTTLGYCGGTWMPVPNEPAIAVPSVDADINYWLAADALGANPTPLCSGGDPATNVFRVDSKSANGQTEVQFVREVGYGHTYEPWTIASAWEFFGTHGRSTFTMAANPATVTVSSPGQSGSTVLTFTAENGFSGSATLSSSSCSNLPAESTCSFSPATITFSSSTTTIPVTLTINTTAASSQASFAPGGKPTSSGDGEVLAACAMGMCILLCCVSRTKRVLPSVVASMGFTLTMIATSCGGGNGASVGGGNPGTPVGDYTGVKVAVTIGGITQSISDLGVDVQ